MRDTRTTEARSSARPSSQRGSHAGPRPGPGALDLDGLARMDGAALARLYAEGRVPDSLRALDGHPRGRMLSVRGLDRGARGGLVRRLASATFFPWGGKSFAAESDARGRGVNRVHLGGRHQLFPFHTSLGASLLDGRPCVVLDYDLPDNPRFIRAIHDEVREVERGLFLGPAMLRRRGADAAFALWFALDTRAQADAIGDKA